MSILYAFYWREQRNIKIKIQILMLRAANVQSSKQDIAPQDGLYSK